MKIYGEASAITAIHSNNQRNDQGYYGWIPYTIYAIDISGCKQLKGLNLHKAEEIKSLDISQNINLRNLSIGYGSLTSLITGNNPELIDILCGNNQLTSLDISGCPKIDQLGCSYNQIRSLDLSKNSNLSIIWVDNNQITSMKMSPDNTNRPTGLDIRNNPILNDRTSLINLVNTLPVSTKSPYLMLENPTSASWINDILRTKGWTIYK